MFRAWIVDLTLPHSARLGTTAILIEFGIIVWITVTGTLRWIEKLLACVSERERERENFSRHTNRNKTSNGTKIYMRDRLPFLLTKKCLVTYPESRLLMFGVYGRTCYCACNGVMVYHIPINSGRSVTVLTDRPNWQRMWKDHRRPIWG